MSALVQAPAPPPVEVRRRRLTLPGHPALVPSVVAAVSALAFFLVRPSVGDLQAALARQKAASDGVGLGYWFGWFGGGATPGNYSVLTPYISAIIGAPLVGVLSTTVIAPLAWRAMRGTPNRLWGMWAAVIATGLSLWSGRIPFALGAALAVAAIIGVRERKLWLAVGGIVASSLCSPVTGVFLAFGLGAFFLVERSYRMLILWVELACGATLLTLLIVFGSAGAQPYEPASALLWVTAVAVLMLFARPAPGLRVLLVCSAVLAPLLTLFENALGSNFNRFAAVCLPAAVLATAAARDRRVRVLAVIPALAVGVGTATRDLVRSSNVAASTSYYQPLIRQLDRLPALDNYRVELVQDPDVHTGAYALVGHAALAGGYETQEQNKLNAILSDRKRLNAVSYKIWLQDNAVGYVAFNRRSGSGAEYDLVERGLSYLTVVSQNARWTLYRVRHANPIVPAPLRLLAASQASMTIEVPAAGTYPVRVRYSKFLSATFGKITGKVTEDPYGWTLFACQTPGRYVLSG